MEDLTKNLQDKTYFPSYNVAYFEDIFNISGSWENVAKYGDWFTYDKTARAKIFERDHKYIPFLHKSKIVPNGHVYHHIEQ